MKTAIYLIRHSEPMKRKPINIENNDSLQLWNEKGILSINGEHKADLLSKSNELQNIDLVISSNYVRAMSTAKYIAEQNDLDLQVIEDFGERRFGIKSWNDLPEGFENRQKEEPNYKLPNGESQIEVANRMHNALIRVLEQNHGKRIAIVSHGTAISFLFMKLGQYKEGNIYFNNNIVIDKNFVWNAPEVFKLEFENDSLMNIINIR